jgi:hypothetical protein
MRLHCLLLQIGSIQEFLEPSLLLPQVLALQSGQFRGYVARGTEVLCGCAVGRLGDDGKKLCQGRRLVQLRAQFATSLTNLSGPARAISGRCVALGDVILVERGEDAPTSVFKTDCFLEEVATRPLQILEELGWIGGEVEWSAQVHDGGIQHVPLWRWKILFL